MKKKTTEEFKQEIYNLVNTEYSVLGEWNGYKINTKWRHNTCGCEWDNTSPRSFIKNGVRCPQCSYRERAIKNTKWSLDTFEEFIKIALFDEYSITGEWYGYREPIKMKHHICGNEWDTTSPCSMVVNGTRCPKCGNEQKPIKNTKWNLDTFREYVETVTKKEYSVTDIKYNGFLKPIKIKHVICNHEWEETTPSSFIHQETRCPICTNERKVEKLLENNLDKSTSFEKWGEDNVCKNFIERYWDNILNTTSSDKITYCSRKTKVYIKCENISHKSYSVYPADFTTHNSRCPVCAKENRMGENNWNYNPNLTNEEREKTRTQLDGENQASWRKSIFSNDDYTCDCCNSRGGKLNAHHLNGYSWDKENRWNISNGITLCNNCHKDFHKLYGRKNNTIQQYEEYSTLINNKIKEIKDRDLNISI